MKKLISAALSLALLISLLSFQVYAGSSTKVNVQSTNALTFDVLEAAKWDKVSSVSTFKNTDDGALIVYPDEKSEKTFMTFSHTFDKAILFEKINEICLEVRVASLYDTFSIKMAAYGKDGVYSDTTEGVCGTKNSLYFKFPEIIKDEIVKIQFTVTAGNEKPETCTLFSLYADNAYSYSYIDLYDTVRFTTVSGDVEYSEKAVRIASSGTSTIDALIAESAAPGGTSLVLSISSSSSGIVHIENPADSKMYQTALYSGTNDYIFFLDTAPETIRIGFSHGEGDGNAQIVLNSMKVSDLGKKVYENLGTVTSCERKSNNITAKGTVTSDAAVQYIDSRLGLFRVSLDGVWENEPLKEIKMSTVFEISANESNNSYVNRYGVAILAEDGIHPLSEPMFATSYVDNTKPYSHTTVGLLNPVSFNVFKSNATSVMLDIWASDLIAKSNSEDAALYPYNNTLYSINKAYFSSIEHDMAFYKSLGCSVYLRINVASVNSYNEHTLRDLQAVLSYISSSLSGISGFMLMPDYPADNENVSKASHVALTLGCLSETLRSVSPDYEIYYCVPEGYNVFAAKVAHYAKFYGLKGISALYHTKSEKDITMLRPTMDVSAFKSAMVCADSISTCQNILEAASKANISYIMLDAKNGLSTEEFMRLNGKQDLNSELSSTADIKGQLQIWDFRDNYSTFGFISGGNMSDPQTTKSSKARVLRATLEKSSGVLLCKMDSELNFAGADGFSIDLSTSAEANMELIIGYSNERKIYKTTSVNGAQTLYAPLDGNGKIEYIALAFTGTDGTTIDISTIGLYSSTLDDSELEGAVRSADTVLQRQTTSYYIIGGGALVLTAIIFILLTKKKEEKASE